MDKYLHNESDSHTKHEEDTVLIEDQTLRQGFTQIPNSILRRSDISPGAKLVYVALISYAWQAGRCFPGQQRLAQDLGSSKRSIIRHLQELQTKGLLRIQRRGLRKTNIYVLTMAATARSDSLSLQKNSSSDAFSLGSAKLPPQEVPYRHTEEYEGKKKIKTSNYSIVKEPYSTGPIDKDLPGVRLHQKSGQLMRIGDVMKRVSQKKRTNSISPSAFAMPEKGPQRGPDGTEEEGIASRSALSSPTVSRAVQTPNRRSRLSPMAQQRLEALISQISAELGDRAHTRSNITQALNIWAETGRHESDLATFMDAAFYALGLTRERSRDIRGSRAAYFFRTFRDKLGLSGRPAHAGRQLATRGG